MFRNKSASYGRPSTKLVPPRPSRIWYSQPKYSSTRSGFRAFAVEDPLYLSRVPDSPIPCRVSAIVERFCNLTQRLPFRPKLANVRRSKCRTLLFDCSPMTISSHTRRPSFYFPGTEHDWCGTEAPSRSKAKTRKLGECIRTKFFPNPPLACFDLEPAAPESDSNSHPAE
jgi:hypothetical protein